MDIFTRSLWSPYAVGVLIGLLNILALILSRKVIGTSSAYAKVSGMFIRSINKDFIEKNEFFAGTKPKLDWGVILVAGIIVGSFISSFISGDFQFSWIPDLWSETVSPAIIPRLLTAFFGGIILAIGARWAGGCTSGHGISGTAQLSPISWAASVSFFAGGIIAAQFIYSL